VSRRGPRDGSGGVGPETEARRVENTRSGGVKAEERV
jgi:hypothetical protein